MLRFDDERNAAPPVGRTCQNPAAVALVTVTLATTADACPGLATPPGRSVSVNTGMRSVPPAPSLNRSAGGFAVLTPGSDSHGMLSLLPSSTAGSPQRRY